METADTGAAEYVSLRRGDSLSWEDLAELASDAGAESALLSLFVTAEFTVLFIVRAGWDAPRVIQASLSAARWEDAQRRLFREVAPLVRQQPPRANLGCPAAVAATRGGAVCRREPPDSW